MEFKEVNGEILMQKADLYEYTLTLLENGELTDKEEEITLSRLSWVDLIKEKVFKSKSNYEIDMNYKIMLNEFKNESFPKNGGLLIASCLLYNFTLAGIDTQEMRNAINASPTLDNDLKSYGLIDYPVY